MKSIAIFFILISTNSILCLAQEQLPTEKKVTFGENGNLFVNKDLGLYLWLSTSPDENSPKHRLMSDTSKKYSNPMYLDTEGYNTFRSPSCVDTVTRKTIYPLQDIIFEVYADGLAPRTTHKFISGNSVYRSGTLYYGGDEKVALSLSASDDVSGLEKTYYSVNGKNYTEKRDTIKLTAEGETILKYYSTDKVGNREEPVEKKFVIDNSSPQTTYEIDGVLNEKFVSPKATIKLKSEDKLVGVKAVYYQINNGAKQVYSAPVSVKKLGSGGVMSFYSVDYLNNTEELQVIGGNGTEVNIEGSGSTFEFYVDNAPPSLAIDFNGEHSEGKYQYVSANTKLKVKANDDKSGVDKVFYSINNTSVDQTYNNEIEFTEEGIAYIRINAVDFVGNKSATVTNAYYVDASAPKSKTTISQPKHIVMDTIYVSSKTKFTLVSTDNASGVKNIVYAINDSKEEQYTSPFSVEGNGLTKIRYRSTDNVSNIEQDQILDVFVDNIPPIIYHHFSTTPIGSKSVRDQEFTIYPSNVQLYVAATDEAAGGEKIVYSINKGTPKSTNPITGLTPGNYEVTVTAYDVLGNSSNETINFSVEK
jgi:hypothetical protein